MAASAPTVTSAQAFMEGWRIIRTVHGNPRLVAPDGRCYTRCAEGDTSPDLIFEGHNMRWVMGVGALLHAMKAAHHSKRGPYR